MRESASATPRSGGRQQAKIFFHKFILGSVYLPLRYFSSSIGESRLSVGLNVPEVKPTFPIRPCESTYGECAGVCSNDKYGSSYLVYISIGFWYIVKNSSRESKALPYSLSKIRRISFRNDE